ncbi:hypothetical protein Tco_1081331 [Tanacetum coccineum]|uniref:Uncharacterized protein n=1 Tax=Tanacetum coccineum TaxID=301880 RepID=A0ABQ5HYF3_9ASTR
MDKNDMNRVVDVDTTDVTAFKSNSTGGTSNLTSKAMEGINSTSGSYIESDVPYGVSDSRETASTQVAGLRIGIEEINVEGLDAATLVPLHGFDSVLSNNGVDANVNGGVAGTSEKEAVEGATVAIPSAAVEEVKNKFGNTLYGYFIGNRIAFPLVEKYGQNLVLNVLCFKMVFSFSNSVLGKEWKGFRQ